MQTSFLSRKTIILGIFVAGQLAQAQSLPEVHNVDLQPLKAQIQRLIQAKDYLGEPFSPKVKKQLSQALGQADANEAVAAVNHEFQVAAEARASMHRRADYFQFIKNVKFRNFGKYVF